ncbi:DUF1801 domain-containing protein [Microbacterium sp. G2-8]|uniref:DUF1801 domain-containing protein n=1 Tax=Microbacterium sp. G2-8 TaxID=2842454 RepID=UPI001C895FD4|nr:DUF1801 domain-containing protein [Microbacterium sp. G2-8]
MTEIDGYIANVTPAKRRRDAATLLPLMAAATGEDPVLTGTIVGFGSYHYRYASGREGDGPAASFAPRKAATTIYLMDGIDAHADELAHLGPHTTGVGCLYIKDLEVCDLDVLRGIIERSYRTLTSGVFGNRAREGGA